MRSQGTGLGLPISRNIVQLMGSTLEKIWQKKLEWMISFLSHWI